MRGVDRTRGLIRLPRGLRLVIPGALAAAALLPGAGSAGAQAAPTNTSEPRILGTAVEGSILTATTGSWSGRTPMTFAYRWLRCPRHGGAPDGSNCGVIANATASEYRLRSADVGFRIRVRVIATNADGSASTASDPTDVVIAARPANVARPTMSGTAAVGQALVANPGTWVGAQPIAFAYRWRRCDRGGGSCSDVSGATASTYTLKAVDAGNTIRVRVTASNSAGATSATSAPTVVVTAAPPTGCPAGSGPVRVDQLSSPARLLVDGLLSSPSPITRSTVTVDLRFHVSACQGRAVQGALVYAAGVPFNQFSVPPEAATGGDGWATLSMHRVAGFPAARNQQLLVVFVRARKAGEPLLGGLSTRRLVSFHVELR